MMSSIWLINTLENALHEPNCLLKEIINENKIKTLTSTELTEEEQAFASQELKGLQDRLNITIKLLNELEFITARTRERQSKLNRVI